jgi:hypothetical protein
LDQKKLRESILSFNTPGVETENGFGYKIVSKDYGEVKDFVVVNMTSEHILFFKKRYLRSSDVRLIVEFDHAMAGSSFGSS